MNPQPNNEMRKPLVSVEFQTEVDVATGSREHRMFIKMYFEARESGLLASIPGELWKMLCCLATYMDENGNCYPTQERIARDLGIRRQRVNERIRDLLNFRFNDQPVLSLKPKTRVRGRWNNNVYRIQPISALKIFDKTEAPTVSADPDMVENRPTVSAFTDTATTDTVGTDTNQMQRLLTRSFNVNDLRKFSKEGTLPSAGAVEDRAAGIVEEILKICGDAHSRGFYRIVAKRAPAELIFAALSETKYQARLGKIRKSRGAFFTDELMRLSRERGIDLRFPASPRAI